MIDDVIARLEAQVAELQSRTFGAAEFTTLMQRKSLPAYPVAAYILPLGLQGSAATAAAGRFIQPIRESIAVVLIVNSLDQLGARALQRLHPMLREIIEAVAGWAPGDEAGVFELTRANIIDPGVGRLAYQIEFSISDQLRIF